MKRHVLEPVPEEAIADLRSRLERFRAVPVPQRDGLGGVDTDVLRELMRYWADDYDWREHERRIASWPWMQTERTAVPIRPLSRGSVLKLWLGLVVLEQINATSGLGYMMFQAQNYGQSDVILVGLVVYGVFGLVSDSAVRLIERRVLSWRRTLSS